MLEHTKTHPTNQKGLVEISFSTEQHYLVPKNRAQEIVDLLDSLSFVRKIESKDEWISIEELFANDIAKYTKPGLALKGARHKEEYTQAKLAKKLKIRQENLSKMENGKRPISLAMAKRFGKVLKVDYRIFL